MVELEVVESFYLLTSNERNFFNIQPSPVSLQSIPTLKDILKKLIYPIMIDLN